MQRVLAGIAQNNFVVLGRAGMDFFPDPPGTKTEEADTFKAGLGGSSANIAAGLVKLGGQAALLSAGGWSPIYAQRCCLDARPKPWPAYIPLPAPALGICGYLAYNGLRA